MKQVVEKRKDIAFYIKLFPLPMHKGSKEKAQAIECKRSLEMLDDAFAGKPLPKPSCPATEIDRNLELGRKLGVNGTPTIILPNGKTVVGAMDAETLIKTLDAAYKEASRKK